MRALADISPGSYATTRYTLRIKHQVSRHVRIMLNKFACFSLVNLFRYQIIKVFAYIYQLLYTLSSQKSRFGLCRVNCTGSMRGSRTTYIGYFTIFQLPRIHFECHQNSTGADRVMHALADISLGPYATTRYLVYVMYTTSRSTPRPPVVVVTFTDRGNDNLWSRGHRTGPKKLWSGRIPQGKVLQ